MVFTDAAHFVAVGQSPYLRSTYRYTPVLAFLLLPTQWMHKDFGKWLFCACDLLTAYFIALILRRLKVSSTSINWMTYLWILNPFVIGISTRGSAESLVCLFCVMTAWLVISNRLFMAAIVFGFVVHLKIYPIIYVVPILCYLGHKELASDTRQQKVEMTRNHSLHLSAHLSPPTSSIYVKHLKELGIMRLMYNKQIWVFALVSAGTFFALGALMTAMYGVEFIQQTYLYHLSRKDHRHNFSIYHLPIYILFHHPSASILSLSAFIPQLISTVVLGLAFKSNLIFAMFTQTFAFVALNKVITSQVCMTVIEIESLVFYVVPVFLATYPASFRFIHSAKMEDWALDDSSMAIAPGMRLNNFLKRQGVVVVTSCTIGNDG